MNTPRPFLLAVLLIVIGIRSVLGAPCCVFVAQANEADQVQHADHVQHDAHDHADDAAQSGHQGHGDDPSANPCCTACGPTLPPEPTVIGAIAMVAAAPQAEPIRKLETRPPFPAYEARGPPLLI
jgi:Protein of unknown function (DUF2946)